jgi:hypothetical protein
MLRNVAVTAEKPVDISMLEFSATFPWAILLAQLGALLCIGAAPRLYLGSMRRPAAPLRIFCGWIAMPRLGQRVARD